MHCTTNTAIRDAFGRIIEFLPDSSITACGGLALAVHHLRYLLMLLHQRLDAKLPYRGLPGRVRYTAAALLDVRLMALLAGKEDLNDMEALVADPGFIMAYGHRKLPSTATLSRFEGAVDEGLLEEGNRFLLDMYFHYSPRKKYIFIDIDNTPVPLYGHQENVKYNGHYGCNCYLPLLAFIDGFPIAVFNGNVDGRKVMVEKLRPIVERIREHNPESIIVLRADSGFNGKELIDLCDELGCYYLIGLAPNNRLKAMLKEWEPEFVDVFRRPPQVGGCLLRKYGELDDYQAASWSKPRRVIVRDYFDEDRSEWDCRFIQTNIPRQSDGRCGKLWRCSAYQLYTQLYCQRGTAEKYNQEFKVQAFGDRASSTRFLTNSYRMLLGALCQLCYRVLRSCFFNKRSSWKNSGLRSFQEAFVLVPARIVEGKRKVKIFLRLEALNQQEVRRYWPDYSP